MKTNLPQGVQDYIGAECANKIRIEQELSAICTAFGYERIQTAAIEYMTGFAGKHGSLASSRMFKMTDRDGELLAVRPDATLQVARIVADKFPQCDLKRFFYVTDTFVADSKDYNRELAQVGAELIGSDDAGSDVEIVELAVKFCLAVGLRDFQIELGNINYFYGIADELELNQEETEALRILINKKDLIAAAVLLKQKGLGEDAIERVNRLPLLFGGEEVFEEAASLTQNEKSVAAVERLKTVLSRLKEIGLDPYITVDLGMVKTNNYYSGLVLRGITKSLGHSFIDGGRYDNLSRNHGIDKPAVGLSLWMKRLLMALDRQNGLIEQPVVDVCVVCQDTAYKKAHDLLEKIRGEGKKAMQYYGTPVAAEAYCLEHKIRRLAIVTEKAITEIEVWKN